MSAKQFLFLVVVFLALNFCLYKAVNMELDTYTRSGVVQAKLVANELNLHKHSGTLTINKYFDVLYDDTKQVEQTVVDTPTYYKFKEGDKVLFTLNKNWTGLQIFYGIVGMISFFVNIAVAITLIFFTLGGIWSSLE